MIRTLLYLLPADSRSAVRTFVAYAVISVLLRAAGIVSLVPLIAALMEQNHSRSWVWLGVLTVTTVLGWVIDAVTSRRSFELGFDMLQSAQQRVADRLSYTALTWFGDRNTTTARAAIAATGPDLMGVVIYLVVPMIGAALLPLCIAIALCGVAWQLALVALAAVPLLLGSLWLTGALTQRADRAADRASSALAERVLEFARTQQALRVSRRVANERSLAGAAVERQHRATLRLLVLQVPGQVVFGLASQLALFGLAVTTVWLTTTGDLTVPQAVALIVVGVRFIEPFTTLAELAPGLETIRVTLRRIREVIDSPTVPSGASAPQWTGPPRIEFQDMRFDYGDTNHPVFEGLNLVVEPGTTTAIIGPSGSGKSTLGALVAGLHQPTGGRILINGIDAATLTTDTRRAVASVVFQDSYLFGGTIADNVAAGDPTASAHQVAAAATLARVDDITARLPRGAEAPVGEGGKALSGGERQRVSIARALLKPAPILVIDEATSALDTENERAVVDALSSDPVPRTRIIIAHRQAAIRHADMVVVLERGRVVESGPPTELLASGGVFARFWHHQSASASWKLTDAGEVPE